MKLRIAILFLLTAVILSSCTFKLGYINNSHITSDNNTTESTAETPSPTVTTTENTTTESDTSTEEQTTPIVTPEQTTPEVTTPEQTTTEKTTSSTDLETTTPSDTEVNLDYIKAEASFIYNVTSNELIAIKGQDKVIMPASITKLLSIQYALSIVPTDLVIAPHSDELSMVGSGSSVAYIKNHHKLTVAQLIMGMMLPSGNDAAYALAAGVGRYIMNDPNMSGKDAVDVFVRGMNDYASSIGCTNTHFTVPDGLAGEEHYTSLSDLIIIGKNALNYELITEYAKIVSTEVTYASGHTNTWNNTNRLINPKDSYYSPYVSGLKTGSLTNNYCLYISADINGSTYLIGIFKSPTKTSRYDDAHIIIDSLLELVE